MTPPRSRRALLVSGVVAVAVYLAGAAISGHLSPLARKPLLDGFQPVPYRWVEPPPALAADNQSPSGGTYRVALTPSGSEFGTFVTNDNAQVSVILDEGAFAPAADQKAVQVTITPIAAGGVSPTDRPLTIVGNVIRFEATYRPSGDPAELERGTTRLVLAYPILSAVHGAHSIVTSTDGATWEAQETNDLPSIRQADALVPVLAYAAVAEEPGASPTPAPGGVNSVATVGIVAAIVVLLVMLFLTLRRRPSTPAPRRRPLQRAKGSASAEKAERVDRRKRR